MNLTESEIGFLTALLREQNQNGCRGPAHDLLRKHAYPDAPTSGPGSLAFAYEVVPLTSVLVADFTGLEKLDDFVRGGKQITDPKWPWSSGEEFRAQLAKAREEWARRQQAGGPQPNG